MWVCVCVFHVNVGEMKKKLDPRPSDSRWYANRNNPEIVYQRQQQEAGSLVWDSETESSLGPGRPAGHRIFRRGAKLAKKNLWSSSRLILRAKKTYFNRPRYFHLIISLEALVTIKMFIELRTSVRVRAKKNRFLWSKQLPTIMPIRVQVFVYYGLLPFSHSFVL